MAPGLWAKLAFIQMLKHIHFNKILLQYIQKRTDIISVNLADVGQPKCFFFGSFAWIDGEATFVQIVMHMIVRIGRVSRFNDCC